MPVLPWVLLEIEGWQVVWPPADTVRHEFLNRLCVCSPVVERYSYAYRRITHNAVDGRE